MKKFILLITFAAIYLFANAQWSNLPTENNLISPAKVLGNTLPKTIVTSDEMMYLSWNSESIKFHTRLQLLDKDGKEMWAKGGILISDHLSPTWTTDYDLDITPDNCAIIALSDGRNIEGGNGFQPFVYKIDKSGNFVWGTDGIQIPFEGNGGTRPRICVSQKGNVIIGFNDIVGKCISLTKLSPNGEILWSGLKIPYGANCNLIPSGEDNFIVSYTLSSGGGSNLLAQKYDPNGEAIWETATDVDITGAVDSKVEFETVSDHSGGIIVLYKVNISSSETYNRLQRVSVNGELMMAPNANISSARGFHNSGRLSFDANNKEIFVFERLNNTKLQLYKFDMDGKSIWAENGITTGENDRGYVPCSSSPLGDGSTILIYAKNTDQNNELCAKKIGKDGSSVWNEKIISNASANKSWVVCTPFFNQQVCAFWADARNGSDPYGYGEIYGQNIGSDGNLGVTKMNIDSKIKNNNFNIFPNPAKNLISIASEHEKIESIIICDLSGKTVMKIEVPKSQIDISTLQTGVYFINIKTANGNFVNKLIKS